METPFARTLYLSTALLAVMTSGALAADIAPPQSLLFAGEFGIEGGVRFYDTTDGAGISDEDMQLGGFGSLNIPLSEMISLQLDTQNEFYIGGHGDDDISMGAHAFGGHLSLRNPESHLIGIFGGGTVASIDEDEQSDNLGPVIGIEGQLYLDAITLYGQAGYADINVDSAGNEGFDGFFVRGVGRLFLTDETVVSAEFAYGFPDKYVDNDNGNVYNWGVEAKTRLLADMPIYGALAYRGGYYDSPADGDHAEEHAVLASLSLLFGASSAKENDRYGATLDMPLLPARAASWVEGID